MKNKNFIKQKQAAAFCGMSVNTFKKAVRPYVPHKRIGRAIYFNIKELKKFMEDTSEQEYRLKKILIEI